MHFNRDEPLIEFVGLPGAGKSTIAQALPPHWRGRGTTAVPPATLHARLRICRVALPLFISNRPLYANDFNRLSKLGSEFRFYEAETVAPLVLDQGMIQKLWSTLHGRRQFSERAVEYFVAAFADQAADVIVWIATPPEEAARRIVARVHGNSRFDGLRLPEITAELNRSQDIYRLLMRMIRKHSTSHVIELTGSEGVEENAASVVACVARLNAARTTSAERGNPPNKE